MTLTAILLVLASAAIHAFWNTLVKRASDKLSFTWLYAAWSVISYFPLAFALRPIKIPWQAWACVVATGVLYSMYFVSLAVAYEHGEMSVVYPIARGIAPALTFLWGVTLLSERVTPASVGGVALVVIAVLMIGRQSSSESPIQHENRKAALTPAGLQAALFTGLTTSGYSISDKIALRYITPEFYVWLAYAACFLMLSPFVLYFRRTEAVREEWRRSWRIAAAVGWMSIGSYLLVLMAMRISNVSYVIPLRSSSILFGVLLGTESLREKRTFAKWIGAVLMGAGIYLIAMKG